MNLPVLSEILIYPIKSLAGISVQDWPVTEKGLLHDRRWMLIDKDGQFLSQRRLPEMALIRTALTATKLILSAPQMPDLVLALQPEDGEVIASQIWQDNCLARHVSNEADLWFSQFLQTECRLVYQPDELIRPVDPRYALPSDQVSFSDGFPFLILSTASLAALTQAMNLKLTMARFRPNLVIANCEPYAEDKWREIAIGKLKFRLPKPCSRCAIPAIDPQTAVLDKTVLTALNQVRNWQNKMYVGQNALHDGLGELRVGDEVVVIASGAAQPPLS